MKEEDKQVHISLTPKAYKELQEIRKSLDLRNISDAIRSSINITSFIAKEKEKGNEIILRDEENGKEKVLATLK